MPRIATRAIRTAAIAGLLFGGSAMLPAQTTPHKSTEADNTKVNKRDRSKAEPTADNAKNNKPDREIMRDIRRSIMDDKSLSTNAHNVKIIAQHGKVTLKGPVNSEDEKKTVVAKATEVAGEGNVTDETTIKAARSKKEK